MMDIHNNLLEKKPIKPKTSISHNIQLPIEQNWKI